MELSTTFFLFLRRLISLAYEDFQHCASCDFAFVDLLNSDRAIRVFFSILGRTCQDVSVVMCDLTLPAVMYD